MKKLFLFLMLMSLVFGFSNEKIENLMGEAQFKSYNQLLNKIFPNKNYNIEEILTILKNNGLLELFFENPKIIHTKFIFENGEKILDTKILNNSLSALGYYYFYPSEIKKRDNTIILNIEFKSEHFIDPVSMIDEMKSRGCQVIDVYKQDGDFNYKFDCENGKIKEAHILNDDDNQMYVNSRGVYWFENNNSTQMLIRARRIDYWHPSIWFYDEKLNLLNNKKINKKTTFITLNIPASCKYIKVTDIYSSENFKRGIIVKGLK